LKQGGKVLLGEDARRRDDRPSGRRKKAIGNETRSEFERDVDRITYNYYFRRLSEITQVSSGHDKVLRHNRMTHSLKVAQVGRRLVQYLEGEGKNKNGIKAAGGVDRNVVTAAGLLHDIGHPPFGHVAEYQLNKIAKRYHVEDGYEGNAQTLRIILSLTAHKRDHDGPDGGLESGMDLTWAVITACIKYPWSRSEAPSDKPNKWGYYSPEEEIFRRDIEGCLPGPGIPTLEAEIMDWADDITYAVHDLQDFYMDGVIPLHHLRHCESGRDGQEPVLRSEFDGFWQYATEKLRKKVHRPLQDARTMFGKYACRFPEGAFKGSREEIARMGALASDIITEASKASEVTKAGRLYVDPEMRAFIYALNEITWYYVIDHPDLVTVQLGQRAAIDQVFGRLYKRVEKCFMQKDEDGVPLTVEEQYIRKRRLPTQLREFTELLLEADHGKGAYIERKQCYARAVMDYIASMTETEFVRMRQQLCPVENYGITDIY
jgi:dGTPase